MGRRGSLPLPVRDEDLSSSQCCHYSSEAGDVEARGTGRLGGRTRWAQIYGGGLEGDSMLEERGAVFAVGTEMFLGRLSACVVRSCGRDGSWQEMNKNCPKRKKSIP